MTRPLGWAAAAVAVGSVMLAVVLGFGLLEPDTSALVSNLSYPPLVFAAAAVILVGARRNTPRDRLAWTLVGLSVACQGIGELVWAIFEVGLGREAPYPGLPDVFYLLDYPILAAGILLMPRVGAPRSERIRMTLDAAVGTLAVGLVGWYLVLLPIYRESVGGSAAETLIGMAYPLGDLILLSAALVLSTRRSAYVGDVRLGILALALVAFTAADFAYVAQSWFGEYSSGGWVDALWLPAIALFAVAGAGLRTRLTPRDVTDRIPPAWQRLLPYVAVAALGVLFVQLLFSEATELPSVALKVGALVAAGLVAVRQHVTLRWTQARLENEQARLVSVISHELRTPLTGVQGFLELVDGEWESLPDDERRELVRLSTEEAKHIGRIVSDLVDVGRGRLHDEQLTMDVVSLTQLTDHVRGLVPGLDRCAVTFAVPDQLRAWADRDRVSQMLVNLLANAVRYGDGRIHVGAEERNGMIEMAVHDGGPGVPERYQHQIWDRFERGANRANTSVAGSGLGLAVVRSLAVAHGGTVSYRRSPRLGGACFSFSIPAAPAPAISTA